MKRNAYVALLLGVAVTIGGLVTPAEAYNSWNGYHWNVIPRDTIKYPLRIGSNVSLSWKTALTGASADWNKSVIKNKVVSGASNGNCDPVSGRTEVCNGLYGETGWLGLTQLWIAPGTEPHITQATLKLNDTYFNTPDFNTNAWKSETMCHEIGHVYGLDHQDTDFNNPNIGSCLDFTADPDGTISGQLSNLHPNQDDYATISYVYKHRHVKTQTSTQSTGVSSYSEVTPNIADDTTSKSDWGVATGRKHNGKNAEFVKELKGGGKIITHVNWAE